jgi:hypothetical protein
MPSHGLRLGRAIIAGAAISLVLPASALSAGISLQRDPAPPSGVAPGNPLDIDFEISFDTVPFSLDYAVIGPDGVTTLDSETIPIGNQSTITDVRQFVVGSGSPEGRYTVQYRFQETQGFEAEAAVVFDVANSLGNLTEVVFHDRNGNRVRDAGEEGISSWLIRLTNPQGNSLRIATGPDGSRTDLNVPAGTWQVATGEDPASSGWVATTPTAAAVNVPTGGLGRFEMGLARPGELCGTVFLDADRDGLLDPAETGAAGIKLELTGTTGAGAAIPTTDLKSRADGSYCFTGLLPGTYTVKVLKPGGYELTTVQVRPGRTVGSGGSNTGNDFGLAAPAAPSPRSTPRLTIDKRGPARVRRSASFPFRVIVRNPSRATAGNVVLIDPVPDTMTLVGRPAGSRLQNGIITWRLGTIRPGRSKAVSMRVRVRPGVQVSSVRNVATVSASGVAPLSDSARVRLTDPPRPPRTGGVTG